MRHRLYKCVDDMSETSIKAVKSLIDIDQIKHSGLKAAATHAYISNREEKLGVYLDLAGYKSANNEDIKRFLAGLARKIVGREEVQVAISGRQQPLMEAIFPSGFDFSQMTRMSIQTSRLNWDYETGVKVLADKDMTNFMSQPEIRDEIVSAIKKLAGEDVKVSFNF